VGDRFAIEDIKFVLGEHALVIRDKFPEFAKVIEKTGIEVVHETKTTAIELANLALEKLLNAHPNLREDASCLLYVSQSPDCYLPSGACTLQNLSGLPTSILAFDIGQGCSGFVQALTVAAKLVNRFENILIVCADTYRSKLNLSDRSTSTVFSDGASAVWISNRPKLEILAESHSTDGSGGKYLYQKISKDEKNSYLVMSGADVLLFTRRVVPGEIESVLTNAGLSSSEVSYCFLHQASKLVLDGLSSRFNGIQSIPTNISQIGNTVSSSIPILMSEFLDEINDSVSIVSGFGVGLSTATAVLGNTELLKNRLDMESGMI
jgi:3-oxoacyl-[acyl-carrier-protein] synthase-3